MTGQTHPFALDDTIPDPPVEGGWSTVQLTDEGHQWLRAAS